MEFFVFLMIELMGFVIGGFIGDAQGKGFHPSCWYGMILATAFYLMFKIGMLEAITDIFD